MGANIEFDIFLKQEGFSLQNVFALLEKEGWSVYIKEVRVFDDWEYTNEKSVDLRTFDMRTNTIFLEHFVLLSFHVNSTWKCVLITSLIEDSYIHLSFGLDTDTLQTIEADIFNNSISRVLFDRIADMINDNIHSNAFRDRFLVASMGIEYSVRFHKDLLTMLRESSGVQRWVLPRQRGKEIILKHFLKEEKSNTIIFTYLHSA